MSFNNPQVSPLAASFKLNVILALTAVASIGGVSYAWMHLLIAHDVLPWIANSVGFATFLGLSIPIPFQIKSNMQLAKAAAFDPLTGLLNRASFNESYYNLLKYASRKHIKFHLLMIDLNKFKQINDSLGHQVGDSVLKYVGRQLSASIRESDTLARLGGDEFAILVPDEDDVKLYEVVINRIIKNVNTSTKIDGHHLYISCSIGVATYPDTGSDSVDLMRCADIAMYTSKRTQRDFSLFRTEDDTANTTDLILMGELRSAIDDGDCEIWFQPKKNLVTNLVDAAECLIRWRHPMRGLINPGTFIEKAEATGLIKHITQFVIREATRSYAKLHDLGHNITLSINVSPIDIVDPAMMTTIIKSIVKSDMPPEKLILEVTETAIMSDSHSMSKVLIALDSLGINLSIDDFGTGHSSLLYLKNFPIYEVKLDRSFITDMVSNKEGFNIVKSTIELSHSLNAITVAEGVEDQATEEILRGLNCNYVQGYYVSGPIPFTEFTAWLDKQKGEVDNA